MIGLSLPVDIPWKRLCVSEDMIARAGEVFAGTRRWRSSLAVFEYTPAAEYQTQEGMIVSYLKVAATITGYQPDPEETGLRDDRIRAVLQDPLVVEEYEKAAAKYYGCYGGILEVIVTPKNQPDLPLDKYPYFSDFEPKKREMYELVTETGELMSRSLENVNVRKGATTSQSHEVLDSTTVDLGLTGTVGGGPEGGPTATGSAGLQHQTGTTDMDQAGYENVRTTDSSREARESFAHTTQITQMYHQLASYHLGTNRALFYMLPRPHIVETERTFVDGPRLLEGIQEFFLVVMRPKEVPEICVEAYLETAHLAKEISELSYETSVGTLELHISLPAPDASEAFGPSYLEVTREGSDKYLPPEGWEVDLERPSNERPARAAVARSGARRIDIPSVVPDRVPSLPDLTPELPPLTPREPGTGGYPPSTTFGYRIDTLTGPGVVSHRVTPARDHVLAEGIVKATYEDFFGPFNERKTDGEFDMKVSVFIRKKQPQVTGYSQMMYITSRGISSCPIVAARSAAATTSVVFEQRMQGTPVAGTRMSIADANRLRAEVGRMLFNSVNHPARRPHGQTGFIDTRFLGRILGLLTKPNADLVGAAAIPGLDATIAQKVLKIAPKITRSRILTMDLQQLATRLKLTLTEAARVRRAAIGLEGPRTDAPAPQKPVRSTPEPEPPKRKK